MEQRIYHQLRSQPKWLSFVRQNPEWYRYLSRDPLKVHEIHDAAKVFYGQTFAQRLENVNQQMQMVGLLTAFAKRRED